MKSFLFLVVFTLFLQSCHQGGCDLVLGVIPLWFHISDSNNDSIFSRKYLGSFPRDSVKFYYKDGQGVEHKDSINISPDTIKAGNFYFIYVSAAESQSISGIHTFYFKRGNNTIDTILFDVSLVGKCQDPVLNTFKYNGIDISHNGEHIVVAH